MFIKLKLKFLIFALLFTTNVFSQTIGPKIPWSQTQADWTFPIYFEDASGARDTFYIFRDSLFIDDPTPYGLISLYRIDTCNSFAVYNTLYSFNYQGYKCSQADGGIGIINAEFPVKITWNLNLYDTDSVLGRDFNFNKLCTGENYACIDNFNNSFDMTANDSILLYDSTLAFPIDIYLRYEDPTFLKNKNLKTENSTLELYINDSMIDFKKKVDMLLIDVVGQLIYKKESIASIDISSIPEGIYTLIITDTNEKTTKIYKIKF
jgi:hypothetical protein